MGPRRRSGVAVLAGLAAAVGLASCYSPAESASEEVDDVSNASTPVETSQPASVVTLAFAGDVHFQLQLAAMLDHPNGALGPIADTLTAADLTMVNLESAITERGSLEAKELEDRDDRYWFRTSPAALDVLDLAGVDVVTMANNHGADYGPVGVQDSLRAIRNGPVAVVGIGKDARAAFAPYRVSVQGTHLAFFGADASMREGMSAAWEAGPRSAGIAAAREDRPRALLAAVSAASRRGDVVVVYLHWGEAMRSCPTAQQRATAEALAEAGADVVVGSHAHVLLGSGWMGETYVDYGLGNFVWYHDHQPETGVLTLRLEDGVVVADAWTPAEIHGWGAPLPLHGRDRAAAIADWRGRRGCTDLAPRPGGASGSHARPDHPAYTSSVSPIGPDLRARMRTSHHSGCPRGWRDLRYLRMSYVGFDGRAHVGEMVVAADYARDVVRVFARLYDARWPIRRMRLVDDFGGDDDRSMAANNTSGYNCRRIADQSSWSAHAYGAAIDVNPVRNPWLTHGVTPPNGRRFAALDRSAGARVPRGVVRADDVVVRAFAAIGWDWGGAWTSRPDYQHFAAR